MNPLDLYQSRIDTVSRAVITGDVGLYLSAMSLPYCITTQGGSFMLRTAGELADMLITLSARLQSLGVTDYVRIARHATYLSHDQIEGMHFTHILRNGERIVAPHAGQQRLSFDGTVWRFIAASYAIGNATVPFAFPEPGPHPETPPRAFDKGPTLHA